MPNDDARMRSETEIAAIAEHAVTKALRAISVPKRRTLTDEEAAAWSEAASDFRDEYEQRDWR